jgi:hypothetical protein
VRVYVSGVDGSPDPDAGVGIARSLKAAFPDCTLIAADINADSTGLLWPDFSESIVLKNVDDAITRCRDLGPNEYWLSSNDMEIDALAATGFANDSILSPPRRCLDLQRKPAPELARQMNWCVPPTLDVRRGGGAVQAFLRDLSAPPWHKTYTHGAARLARHEVAVAEGLLQAHVDGVVEVIAFAAWRGDVLGAVYLRKRQVTDLGKTWTGDLSEVDDSLRPRLEALATETDWHGGGVLEFVRDAADTRWLIDVNPRFPAWVHGATLCGINLPGRLLAAASGRSFADEGLVRTKFSRVVVEVIEQRM